MQNITSIGYQDFLRASSRGAAHVSVHKQLAARVMSTSLIPDDYRMAFRLWTWLWLSLVPVALVIGSAYSWWWTPMLIATLLVAQSITRSKTASKFVVDFAREDELFYDIMVTLGVLRVTERRRSCILGAEYQASHRT
ncbi:MAG: hypothetical protein RLN69_00240 [Woeseiaceae bacterium]